MAVWFYRVGMVSIDVNHRRAFWSETWVATTAAPSDALVSADLAFCAGMLGSPFGNQHASLIYNGQLVIDELFPRVKNLRGYSQSYLLPQTVLNPAAPEAGFRLQRVGASGRPGRLCPPIQSDDWFTDLPRRRHVKADDLQDLLDNPLYQHPQSVTGPSGRTYQNCIIRRNTLAYEPVTHYIIQPNPVRFWSRWREYDITSRPISDRTFTPNELNL